MYTERLTQCSINVLGTERNPRTASEAQAAQITRSDPHTLSGHLRLHSPSRSGPGPKHHHSRNSYRESRWYEPRAEKSLSAKGQRGQARPHSDPNSSLFHSHFSSRAQDRKAYIANPELPENHAAPHFLHCLGRRHLQPLHVTRVATGACVLIALLRLRGNAPPPARLNIARFCPVSVHVPSFRKLVLAKHPGFSF